MARVAVFGGSFNPIHYGHLLLADEVLERLDVDRILFVPAGTPPHKPRGQLAPAEERCAMVRMAIAGHPGFAVSDLELRRAGPSYTVDTLEALAVTGDALTLLLGSETFLDLLAWREPRRIAALARLAVVPRTGSAFDPAGAAAQKVLREIGV
ncbi:MAG TPA: nicotinate (nicotinamide) nucleotide adenylyltransferase, partial [Candidatus Tectomicrobia bacterium]|nr:nicotinate (nicotinamide) nucleotide adenylyltransferase [Candidatus Tectomicrobia bacterium]